MDGNLKTAGAQASAVAFRVMGMPEWCRCVKLSTCGVKNFWENQTRGIIIHNAGSQHVHLIMTAEQVLWKIWHPGCFWNSGNLLDEATGNEKKRMVRSIHASCDQGVKREDVTFDREPFVRSCWSLISPWPSWYMALNWTCALSSGRKYGGLRFFIGNLNCGLWILA